MIEKFRMWSKAIDFQYKRSSADKISGEQGRADDAGAGVEFGRDDVAGFKSLKIAVCSGLGNGPVREADLRHRSPRRQ